MSLQNATMCAIGIDIVTQQQKVAKASAASTRLGGSPNTLSPRAARLQGGPVAGTGDRDGGAGHPACICLHLR
jgi:hypothetical protein